MSDITKEEKLKPCPFCSGEAHFVRLDRSCYKSAIKCSKCDCTIGGSAFQNNGYNAAMWNTRQSSPEKAALAAEAYQVIGALRSEHQITPETERALDYFSAIASGKPHAASVLPFCDDWTQRASRDRCATHAGNPCTCVTGSIQTCRYCSQQDRDDLN